MWWVAGGLVVALIATLAFVFTRGSVAPGRLLLLASVTRPAPRDGKTVTARVVGLQIEGAATAGGWQSVEFSRVDLKLPGAYLAPNTTTILQTDVAAGSYSRVRLDLGTARGQLQVDRPVGFRVVSGQTTPLLFTFQVGSPGLTVGAAYGGESQVSFGLALASREIQKVPSTTFLNQQGQAVRLSQYRGKVVVLASFLTECQETCPLVAAALLQLHRMLQQQGLAGRVQILEATQDPAADTPAILSKYQRYFSLPWPLLTGPPAAINSFWSVLGVPPVQALPWNGPAPTDLFTGRPEPFNLIHASVLEVINPQGYIVTVMQSQPTLSPSTVPTTIYRYLDAQGRSELKTGGSWTPATVYQAIIPLLQQQREVNAFPKTSQAVPGGPAPNFTLTSTTGSRVTLSELRGHPVMLDFWASWCTNCRADMGLVATAARRYSTRGLRVLLINDQQSAQTARNFLTALGIKLPSLLDRDGQVAQEYGLPGLPVAVFIRPNGKISSLVLGQLQESQLRAAVTRLLAA
jgi:cytochrome oxidase Cu insertion factor (SCO1/SenC/PrrC family)